MHIRGAGADGPRPQFDPSGIVGAFPAAVAAAAGKWDGAVPFVSVMTNDDEPWAVELYYPVESRPGLAVRTIRSRQGLSSRGMPVEDLASVMVNFMLNNVEVTRPDVSAGSEAHVDAIIARSRGIRAQASETEAVRTAIFIDGDEYGARRIDVLGCTAVEVPWAQQTVFCVATATEIDGLRLRTLQPQETARW
jgi:hypothetical protein